MKREGEYYEITRHNQYKMERLNKRSGNNENGEAVETPVKAPEVGETAPPAEEKPTPTDRDAGEKADRDRDRQEAEAIKRSLTESNRELTSQQKEAIWSLQQDISKGYFGTVFARQESYETIGQAVSSLQKLIEETVDLIRGLEEGRSNINTKGIKAFFLGSKRLREGFEHSIDEQREVLRRAMSYRDSLGGVDPKQKTYY